MCANFLGTQCDLCNCWFRALFFFCQFLFYFWKKFGVICSILLRNINYVCMRCLLPSFTSLIFSLASYPVLFSHFVTELSQKVHVIASQIYLFSSSLLLMFFNFVMVLLCSLSDFTFLLFFCWYSYVYYLSFFLPHLFRSSFWYFITSMLCLNPSDSGVICPFLPSMGKQITSQEIHVNSQHSSMAHRSFVWWFCTYLSYLVGCS